MAVRLRVRRIHTEEEEEKDEAKIGVWEQIRRFPRRFPMRLLRILRDEVAPIPGPGVERIRIDRPSPERKIYIAWTWFLSTAIVIHLLFGSLVLSGLLFIGPRDALFVIFRYLVSVLACRAIVTFELAGMRPNVVWETDEGEATQGMELQAKPTARATY